MIHHTTTFTSPVMAPVARGSFLGWLQSIGYRVTTPPFLSSVQAERGSWMGNVGSLNPRMWRVTVRAAFKPLEVGCEVTLEWIITTIGQTTTKADIQFWRMEVERSIGVCLGIVADVKEYQTAAQKAQGGDTWRAIVFSGFVIVPPLAVLSTGGSPPMAALASLLLGGPAYFVFRAPRTLGEIPIPDRPVDAPPVAGSSSG